MPETVSRLTVVAVGAGPLLAVHDPHGGVSAQRDHDVGDDPAQRIRVLLHLVERQHEAEGLAARQDRQGADPFLREHVVHDDGVSGLVHGDGTALFRIHLFDRVLHARQLVDQRAVDVALCDHVAVLEQGDAYRVLGQRRHHLRR